MDYRGFAEFDKFLDELTGEELKRVEKTSLEAGAKVIKKQQEINWNRSNKDDEHIEDNIIIGRVYEVEDGSKVSIAPKMTLRWRAKFVEYGTSYQAPQAPTERSVTIAGNQASHLMIKELEKLIK